jgi:divalent metal cation (Fe/Co/Zn/Cd) transporter
VEHPERKDLLHLAVRFSVASVGWGIVSGISGVVAGAASHSVALIAFGLGAIIDSLASGVLVRRFAIERKEPHRAEAVEHAGLRVVGALLLVASVYVVVQAVRSLLADTERGSLVAPVLIAAASALVLHYLGRRKLQISRGLGSRALRADAVLSLLGSVLSASILFSLAMEQAFGWRWIDPVAAILVALVLAREGWIAIRVTREAG